MVRVLVVDDSLFMRTLVADMLNSDPDIEVTGRARNGSEALQMIASDRPDVVTLDLAMPECDGLTTLKNIIARDPLPVIIVSAYSKKDADITIQCLNEGAVGFVCKPSGELSLDIEAIRVQLLAEVKAAVTVTVGSIKPLATKPASSQAARSSQAKQVIVIGASTGGPQTLAQILSQLPADLPLPIVIVQHIPDRFFSESLVRHLNRVCALKTGLAEDGEIIRSAKVYLVPAGHRFTFKRANDSRQADVLGHLQQDKSGRSGPSIDLTMKSAAQVYAEHAVGIILSGIGKDGLQGMQAIRQHGGRTIAQDESALIFGMPHAVISAGCADRVLDADGIAQAMMQSWH
jgi:two-component system chemotaxis response regulator CheB